MASRYGIPIDPFSVWRNYKLRPSRMVLDSKTFIDRTHSIADCTSTENDLSKQLVNEDYIFMGYRLWSAVFILGIGIGLLGALQSIAIEELLILRNEAIGRTLKNNMVTGHLFWIAMNFLPVIICAAVIVYYEPNAEGLGISKIFAYMNGINIDGFQSIKTAIIKFIVVFLVAVAGLPGGKEEPFIHFGAIFAGSLSRLTIPFVKWRPYLIYSDPVGRRDLVTAGTVASVAVAFGTPIGAVLFCLEEGITFWNSRLTFIMFVCCVLATFTSHVTRTFIIHGTHISTPLINYMFFPGASHMELTYDFSDIPLFILFGLIGAFLGSLWHICFTTLYNVRTRIFKGNRHWKFIEAIIFGVIHFILSAFFFNLSKNSCSKVYEGQTRLSRSKDMNVYCDKDTFESSAAFVFQDSRFVLMSIMSIDKEGLMSNTIIILGMVYYFVLSVLQSGTILPSGIIVPHIISGAAWGHVLCNLMLPEHRLEKEGFRAKFTFFGALAQGSGITRFTLSLGVILIESSGQTNFAIPVFVIVLAAKWFGGLMTEPIFRTIAYLKAYPLIRSTLLPVSSFFTATEIMQSPIEGIPMSVSVRDAVRYLRRRDHENYPILQNDKVVGVVLRRQILTLLASEKFKTPETKSEMEDMKNTFLLYEGISFKKFKEKIKRGEFKPETNQVINFQMYVNKFPYMVTEEMSLRRIYDLFLALCPGFVIVVDRNGNAVGIITRKDVARFRKFQQFLIVRTEIVPII